MNEREIGPVATLAGKLASAKSRVTNAQSNLERTILAKQKKAQGDIAQKTNEINQALEAEIKNQHGSFIKELEEALDPFISELISQLNFYGSLSMLDKKQYDKFLELITLINDSHPYVLQICSGDVSSNLVRTKWSNLKRMAETLSSHFNNKETFYGHGHKANVEFSDTNHVTTTQR